MGRQRLPACTRLADPARGLAWRRAALSRRRRAPAATSSVHLRLRYRSRCELQPPAISDERARMSIWLLSEGLRPPIIGCAFRVSIRSRGFASRRGQTGGTRRHRRSSSGCWLPGVVGIDVRRDELSRRPLDVLTALRERAVTVDLHSGVSRDSSAYCGAPTEGRSSSAPAREAPKSGWESAVGGRGTERFAAWLLMVGFLSRCRHRCRRPSLGRRNAARSYRPRHRRRRLRAPPSAR
jgi:hypothetical protein